MKYRYKITKGDMTLISICFFLSGMSGLIYQVLWTKMLGLVFGNTSLAISTVISVFLAGLALGSFILGRIADKPNNIFEKFGSKFPGPWQIKSYCVLEILIGVFCFLSPYFFKGMEVIYLQCTDMPAVALNLIRFFLCAIVMIIPTMAMGATLPLMSKFFISANNEVGEKLGWIYSINTAGSVLGTFLAGFVLLPNIGISLTLSCACVVNLGVGFLLLSYSRGMERVDSEDKPLEKPSKKSEESDNVVVSDNTTASRKLINIFVVVFAMSGFASLVYELAWNRSLALALGSSTYAFSAMLTTFLFGTALGSFIFSNLSKKRDFTFFSFAVIQVLIGLFSMLSVLLLGKLPLIFGSILPFIKHSYNLVIIVDFLICFASMILPTILIGISFPLAGKLYTDKIESLGKSIGDIYAINTIGSVSGSFLTGFVLMPTIGIQNTIILAVCFNMLGALLLVIATDGKPQLKYSLISVILVCITGLFFLPRWDSKLMTSGAFRGFGTTEQALRSNQILFYKDGISCTVATIAVGDIIFVNVNGKTDASSGLDMSTQIMVGYLPVFYHSNPKTAFLLGLGSGVTAGAILDDPSIERVDCVEIEPAMKEAALFFKDYNHDVFNNPRFNFIVNDGRNKLLSSKNKYDVIVSEPSNPWVAGVASLFTKEYFELCKNRLNEGGIFCAWVQLYSINPQDVKMILNTISSVFPEIDIYLSSAMSDCVIIASEKPLVFKYDRFMNLYNTSDNVKKYMRFSHLKSPDEFLATYIADGKSIESLIFGSKINTDDLTSLEYSAPLSLYNTSASTNISGILNFKNSIQPKIEKFEIEDSEFKMPPSFYAKGFERFSVYNSKASEMVLYEGLRLYPENSSLNLFKISNLLNLKYVDKAEELLNTLIKDNPEKVEYLAFKANYLADIGRFKEAESVYETIYDKASAGITMEMALKYFYTLEKLEKYENILAISDWAILKFNGDTNFKFHKFKALAELGRNDEAEILTEEILRAGFSAEIYDYIANFYLNNNKLQEAITVARNYFEVSGHDEKSAELTINIFNKQQRFEDARAVAFDVLPKYPYNKLFLETVRGEN